MRKALTVFIITISLIFFVAVALDISPLLRGPSNAEWRWPYLFINTLNKIWFPIIIGGLILTVYKIRPPKILVWLIVLGFLWQISVISFSRAGIGVLAHRIYNPGLNGYYSAGLAIKDLPGFITDYPRIVLDLPMHAKGHPPGGPIFFYFLNILFNNFHLDFKIVSLIYALIISAISNLTVIPLYLLIKKRVNESAAVTGAFFYILIPSITLFLPIFDVVFPGFVIVTACLLAFKKDLAAGLVFAIGLFFTYSILPALLYFVFLKPKKIFFLPIIIYFFLFWETFLTVIGGQAQRDYFIWIFYNLWDFIIFAGFPLIILFVSSLRAKGEAIFLVITILLLNLSGASRAETGRIWSPLMPLLIMPAVSFLNTHKFKANFVMIFLGLQMIQTLVIQEFWVPLW